MEFAENRKKPSYLKNSEQTVYIIFELKRRLDPKDSNFSKESLYSW